MKKHLRYAFSQYGVKELEGNKNNAQIISYFKELGYKGKMIKEDTAWCSTFVNWVLKMCDAPYTGKLNARSWLEIGMETNNPQPGDIVVLWRESKKGLKGYVGFYISEVDDEIFVLGGNQDNQVKISGYPSSRLLGYRVII
jgi:uncharacterized protein (TIGR02594 family)